MSDIKQLDSRVVYKNKWMTVREDKVQRLDGSTGIYGVVEKPDFVVIVPIQDGTIYLVEQFRYPVAERYWELPQGSWETAPNSDPLEVARGELREETGLIAQSIKHIGYQFLAPGYSNQGYHIYFATHFKVSTQRLDDEETDLVSAPITLQTFEQMILSGEIKDATTVNAYNIAKMKGFI